MVFIGLFIGWWALFIWVVNNGWMYLVCSCEKKLGINISASAIELGFQNFNYGSPIAIGDCQPDRRYAC